jgi:hypothetical protein
VDCRNFLKQVDRHEFRRIKGVVKLSQKLESYQTNEFDRATKKEKKE